MKIAYLNHAPIALALAVGLVSLASLAPVAAEAQERRIVVDPPPLVKTLVPQALLRGDREFGGHGPEITITVDLHPSSDGAWLEADVFLHAIETQDNWSETERRWNNQRVMQMRPGERLIRVEGPTHSRMNFISAAGRLPGMAAGGVARRGVRGEEDGGCICTHFASGSGPVNAVVYLGDTAGDDISSDENGHGDLSIREIHFNRVTLIVQ